MQSMIVIVIYGYQWINLLACIDKIAQEGGATGMAGKKMAVACTRDAFLPYG